MINTEFKKQEQSFSLDAMQTYTGEIEEDLTKTKKEKFTHEALYHFFFTIFPDFISIFQTFYRSGKLLARFQEFKTMYERCPKHQTFSRQMLTGRTSRKRPPLVSDRYQFLGLKVL